MDHPVKTKAMAMIETNGQISHEMIRVVEVDGVINMELPHLFECAGVPQGYHKLEQVLLHLI